MGLDFPVWRRYLLFIALHLFPGQLKLQKASVVVVGAGGLGCPALQYLGAAGIGAIQSFRPSLFSNSFFQYISGRIGIIDHDRVELSNLGRQILHSEETVGMFKSESAAQALKKYVHPAIPKGQLKIYLADSIPTSLSM